MNKKKMNNLNQEELEVVEEDLVEDDLDEAEILEAKDQEIQALKDELVEEQNKFLKAHADLENTKRRLSNDFAKRSKYLIQDFALSILPVMDNLEKVLAESSEEDSSFIEAIEMIYRQLKTSLNAQGVEEVEALDQKFDPNFHHAVIMEEVEDVESGIVIEVLQKGYKLKDRVLRASLVKVSQ